MEVIRVARIGRDEPMVVQILPGNELGLASRGVSVSQADAVSLGLANGDGKQTPERAAALFEKAGREANYKEEKIIFLVADETVLSFITMMNLAWESRKYGDLSSECFSYYYNCSCTLLYKPQEETDPLGDVPNDSSRNSDKDELASKAEEHGSSVMPYNSKTTNLEDGPIFLFYRSSFNDFKVEGA
ncbi:hypothetical protein HPP92_017200 [Vanilla planifolia]|nr:hypothetical protein HPP92_017200 [Vanilla planifolia]